MDFKGKVALITGGGRGIGKAAAMKFAEGGADIVIADIDPQTGKDTSEELAALGVTAISISLDIGDISQIESMVEKSVSELGSIDILFNNAGLTRHISFFDIEDPKMQEIRKIIEDLDIDNLSPVEALLKLNQIKKEIKDGD